MGERSGKAIRKGQAAWKHRAPKGRRKGERRENGMESGPNLIRPNNKRRSKIAIRVMSIIYERHSLVWANTV